VWRSRAVPPSVTSFDDGAAAGPESSGTSTVPFVPSAVEMFVLRQIGSGESPLPVLPDLPGESMETRVRAARASLAGAVRRYAVQAARLLRRGETVARVCETAATALGLAEPHALLAGLSHNTGGLWLLGIADRLAEPALHDTILSLLSNYQGAASVQLAERWGQPADVVLGCRETGWRLARHPVERLVRLGVLLAPAVEARLDGGAADWNDALVGDLGVAPGLAMQIVRDSAAALADDGVVTSAR